MHNKIRRDWKSQVNKSQTQRDRLNLNVYVVMFWYHWFVLILVQVSCIDVSSEKKGKYTNSDYCHSGHKGKRCQGKSFGGTEWRRFRSALKWVAVTPMWESEEGRREGRQAMEKALKDWYGNNISRTVSMFRNEFRPFVLHGANACWNLFCSAVAHMFQLKVSTCNSRFRFVGATMYLCPLKLSFSC